MAAAQALVVAVEAIVRGVLRTRMRPGVRACDTKLVICVCMCVCTPPLLGASTRAPLAST